MVIMVWYRYQKWYHTRYHSTVPVFIMKNMFCKVKNPQNLRQAVSLYSTVTDSRLQ